MKSLKLIISLFGISNANYFNQKVISNPSFIGYNPAKNTLIISKAVSRIHTLIIQRTFDLITHKPLTIFQLPKHNN